MTISNDAAARAAAAAAAREAARRAAEAAAKKAAQEAARKAAAQKAAAEAAHHEPRMSAPRPVARPSAPPLGAEEKSKINVSTGRTSSFEAFRPPPVALEKPSTSAAHAAYEPRDHHRNNDATSEGRGTNDDSIGRGTNDDSIGRGTNDDSIGRGTNDDSIGRGTNDDSIGRGTNDDSIGRGGGVKPGSILDGLGTSVEEPTNQGVALPSPATAGLSPETAAKMDALVADHSDKARQARYVFNNPAFEAMPAEQRTQIVNVMSAGGDRVGRGMAEMFEQSNGAMLSDTGKDGVTVLDSLEKMSKTNSGVVGDVMYDLVEPGRIRQGRAPTCTVTSMQYELAHEAPGEYARLMEGLIDNGKVTMLGGGELVTDAKWDQTASEAKNDGRTHSEAIFQAAAMEYANGSDTYLEYAQESVGSKDPYQGLHAEQITTMVGQLFGVDYKTREIGTNKEADDELKEILSRERPNRPVLFDIMIDGQQSNHLVSLETVKNGNVYYRDPTTGEREHMTVEEFRHNLVAVHYAEQATGFFDKVGGLIGRAAGSAVSGASSVGSALGNAFSSVGSAAGSAVSAVGNAAGSVAGAAGHAIGGALNRFKGLFG